MERDSPGDPGLPPEPGPRVRVNQLGYLPDGPRRATLVTAASAPVPWRLRDPAGFTLASGATRPRGLARSAGLTVHTIDFGHATATGAGLRLEVDGEQSYPFTVGSGIYDGLRCDAVAYFYPMRSGTPIVPIELDGVWYWREHARPAGHLARPGGPQRNQGDLAVPCLPDEDPPDHRGRPQPGGLRQYGPAGWQAPDGYARDVTGGWYDAGDHGKYVVNAGITVWLLLSAYERLRRSGRHGVLGDGSLPIPECANGVPDLLDEVRWELDWLLAMQVPDGTRMRIDGQWREAGGLAHHKLHDVAWTPLGTLPHEDPMPRYLHRPSTAATLNLAAAAAQAARVYDEVDQAYADRLLAAARRAWRAAAAHPGLLAPDTNRLDPSPGGGPYQDTELGDEFYWAAAQLFLTTGEVEYEAAVLASPYHPGGAEAEIWRPTGFDWRFTAAAGRLDLATVPSLLPGRAAVVASVVAGAERYLELQAAEPFGHPYPAEHYEWGSSHQVVNNAIVLATAYDLTGRRGFRDGALEAIDYVFGRNALNNCYVAGYGTRASRYLHSRWYASDPRLPPVPPGTLASGANSGLQDPLVQRYRHGAAPQACYLDHPEAYSTNETAINWNASLAWYAIWAADQARPGG